MEKHLTIKIPEGFEIDKEKSTFDKIVFKSIEQSNENKIKEMSDFLFSMFNDVTMKITGEKELTFYKGNEWVFQQDWKNRTLWVRYSLIWKVFEDRSQLNYNQIKEFISGWVETNTNWQGLTPVDSSLPFITLW